MSRLLLIEDHAETLRLTRVMLVHHGFEVVGAARYTHACAELCRRTFDLVLTDLTVDHRDHAVSWQDVAALVRLARPTPVALLSGWAVSEEQVADHGLAFAVRKPFDMELFSKVAGALACPELTPTRHAGLLAYFRCLEDSDWDGVVAGCTEDVVYTLPSMAPRFGCVVAGRAELRAFAELTFRQFPEPQFEIESVRALPQGAVVHYRGSWRAADGTRPVVPGAVLFVFRGDLVAEIGVRMDVSTLPAPA